MTVPLLTLPVCLILVKILSTYSPGTMPDSHEDSVYLILHTLPLLTRPVVTASYTYSMPDLILVKILYTLPSLPKEMVKNLNMKCVALSVQELTSVEERNHLSVAYKNDCC